MTEQVQGDGANSNFAPAAPQPQSTPQSPPATNTEAERTFRQSEVNDLVGRAKSEAVERFKRETAMSSHQTPQPQYTPPAAIPQTPYTAPPPPPGVTPDEAKRLAAEEFQKQRNDWVMETQRNQQEQEAKNVAEQFFGKLEAGKSKFDDFETVIGSVDLRTIPNHVMLANMVEGTDEVMYEMLKNPIRLGQVQGLIDIDVRAGKKPTLALKYMQDLSQSLRENDKARKYRPPKAPLSQLSPSNAGTDSGARVAGDYRKNPAYRR